MAATVVKLGKPVFGFWDPGMAGDQETEPEDIIELKDREIARLNRKLEAVKGEIQKTREQAYTQGFEDGLVAEREKHKQALETHARQIKDLSVRLESEMGQALQLMEKPLLQMSFNIAEKILRAPLPTDFREQALTAAVKSFLKEVIHADSITVRVARENIDLFQKEEVVEQLDYPTPERLRFVADSNLQPGECRVETPEHLIEGSYSTQLANLALELQ